MHSITFNSSRELWTIPEEPSSQTAELPDRHLFLPSCDAASKLIASGKVGRGIQCLEQLAERGSEEAQMKLGDLYSKGELIAPNRVQAIRYYRMAAEKSSEAKVRLAILLTSSSKTQSVALRLLKEAAGQGDAAALFCLGDAYERGILGLKRDIRKSIGYLEKASRRNCPDATVMLAAVKRGRLRKAESSADNS